MNKCGQNNAHHTTFPLPVSPAIKDVVYLHPTMSYVIMFPNWSRPTTTGSRYFFNNGAIACNCSCIVLNHHQNEIHGVQTF